MKKIKLITGFIAILIASICLYTSVQLIANHQIFLGAFISIWCIGVIIFVSEWVVHEMNNKIKYFTLMELLAVITIMSILLTVAFRSFKTDPQKSDAIRLSSELKLLHTQSFTYDNDTGYEREFIIEDNFISEIVPSHTDLSFNKGTPSEIGYSIEIKYKEQKPITIHVAPFTGKVKFYKYD